MKKYKNYLLAILGGFIFAFTINVLLMPLSLYNGGLTGVAQLLRNEVVFRFGIDPGFEIGGLINFLINVPIFIFAYKHMSKRFVIYSLFAIGAQTIGMSLIPIPAKPLLSDFFITILAAAVIGGYGVSLTFKGKGSAGGLDIVGIYYSQKKKGSVGKIYLTVNFFVYLYCFIFYDLQTTVYSFLYSTMFSFTLDKFHHSNIEVSVMVFTKNRQIKSVVNSEMIRGATYWEGYGSFTNTPMDVFVSIVSQEEVEQFKRLVRQHDPDAFIVITENLKVVGGYEKRLI